MFILALLSINAIPVYSLMASSQRKLPVQADSTSYYARRQNGNSDAAGDLYGIGIRVSAYLQILGMLLSCLRSNKRSRTGIKLWSSAVCVSLLSSLTALVCNRSISPCEAWLVFSLVNAYGTPRSAAINKMGKKKGGIAVLFAGISLVWQSVLFIVHTLPLLGTHNRVWFLYGGRYFRLVQNRDACL